MPGKPDRSAAGLATAILLVAAVSAFAHSGAKGIVKQRMDAMGDIADQMEVLGAMMKKQTDFNPAIASKAADAIAGHALHIPTLFPEGSNEHPSEALPAIWTDWAKFEAIATELKDGASELSVTAGSAASTMEIAASFGKVAKTCISCHEGFRLKK
ncbi:MAG: cytochrome c [Rhizobiaceae bacterium]